VSAPGAGARRGARLHELAHHVAESVGELVCCVCGFRVVCTREDARHYSRSGSWPYCCRLRMTLRDVRPHAVEVAHG
jgi:hypothetical protein